jgi:hypothetical protein
MKSQEETRDRFLGAIAERVQRDGIVEAHLFQPLKQGEFESAVAVIAVSEEPSVPDGTGDDSPEQRLAVYTAKYRLTIKGTERGKWDFEMHAEADAPLATVDTVVRGVQRRSGDAQEPERLTGDEFRALLPPPPAGNEASA